MSATEEGSVEELPSDTLVTATTTTTTEEYNSDLYDFAEEEAEAEEEEELYICGEDYISGPFFSEQSTVPRNILELHCSYGYDCKRYFNICAPDKDTVVFASGNLIHFFDIPGDVIWTRRSYLGGGIGHIIVNPNPIYPHLAVAENGENPPIIIYRWPEMDIAAILKEGAAKRYAHVNFSPDGELLVSQSYGPDFLITVWRWKRWRTSPIILRIKSHVTDVFKCMFSPYVPGQISTGGAGHIKFWKMAQTFTGLKLQGELGRFGKTEISDIVGVHPMPDEKVISGSEWGNLLVWEAGLIKIEVYRTMRRRCHGGPVMQLEYIRNKGEIWSISLDGWLRAWEYRIIDEADPPDDDRVVQMVPSYERHTPTVQYMAICKERIYEPECTHYFAQDGNGGIWLVDLILRFEYESSKCLRRFHAGPVADMQACPWGPYIASLGDAGSLHLYDYAQMILVFRHVFNAKGRALIWVPIKVEPSGCFLIAGFDDGVVRIVALHFPSDPEKLSFTKPEIEYENRIKFTLIQSIKPHNRPLTKMTLSPNGQILVTGGEDKTIFIFKVYRENSGIHLKPIGFCPLDAIPTCFTWHPTILNTLLIGCMHGEMFQFTLPQDPVNYTKISFLLHTIKPIRNRFPTCKSLIRRRLHIQEIERRKAEKVERKRREMAKLKAENPGLDIDEELFLQDSESEEILEPLFIPPVPNRIIFMEFTPEDTIWVSVSGFDAGYIYEMQMDVKDEEPVNATMVEDADDVEMHGILYSPDNEYLITSMETGQIRVNRINPDDFRDLSDYWLLSMHDNFNGRINKMCFSYDNELFFSCGEDGNLFAYNYNSMEDFSIEIPVLERMPKVSACPVDENYESLSLEEVMIKAEYDKQMRLANEHKRKLRNRLNELRNKLTTLLERNCNLPKSQRYTLREFIIDDRIMKALDDRLGAKVALEKRKLAYDVEKSTVALKKLQKYYTECLDVYPIDVKAFHKPVAVGTISQRSLGKKFYDTYGLVEKRIEEEFLIGRIPVRRHIVGDTLEEKKKKPRELEPFLVGLSPSTIEFRLGVKLTRLLKRYRERRAKKEQRQEEWNEMLAKKPDPSKNHPEDEESLSRAEAGIGDFKLKTAPDYKVPEVLRESMVKKYLQLLDARLKAYKEMLYVFNRRVYKLRDEKVRLIGILKNIESRIYELHDEFPDCRKILPMNIPEMTPEDFPEKEVELKMNVEPSFQASLKKKKVSEDDTKKSEKKDLDLFKIAYRIDKLPDLKGSPREIIEQVMHLSINPFNKVLPPDSVTWELEIKARRLINNIFEQDELLKQMQDIIIRFDKEIVDSVKQRFDTRTACNFMDLHILVLNQELIIVKDFETYENELSATALEKYNLMMDMKDNMKRTELKIEKHLHNIDKCNEEIKELQQTFLTAAKDNKFWDFLRRIFKKKWRPPKIVNPDDSESSSFSSSSSSSSEEDDAGSLDSRDIGPIRLDESVCPKGCDKEIYEYTFLLRSKRHEQERQIIEEKKAIEGFKKDMEQAAKKMKIAELASKQSTDTLEEYRCKKQRALNEVNCTIVLKLSQLRHIIINDKQFSYAKLADTLVFGRNMLGCLFTRVNELLKETLEERGRFRRNRLHLHRMNVDINHMNNQISKLKADIVDLMLIKFGRKVNIDELEESILKRLVQDLKFALLKFGEEYERQLENCRKVYGEKQIELKAIIRENTARLELLGILNKERTKLSKIIEQQHLLKEKGQLKEDLYYLDDIDKLVEVSRSQKDEIQRLKQEIKALNTKSLPLEVLHPKDIEKVKGPEKDEIIVEYDESLDELFVAPEYKPIEIPDISKENLETNITEEELMICIQELMTEIAETNIKSETFPEIIPKILCEVIEQVPLKYLHRTESIEHIANIISDILTDVSKINKNQIIDTLSKRTTINIKEIADILEAFIRKTNEKIEEMQRSAEQSEKSSDRKLSDRTDTSGKSSETQSSTTEKSKKKKQTSERSSFSTEKSIEGKKSSTSKQSSLEKSTEKSLQKKSSERSIKKKSSSEHSSTTEKPLQKKTSSELSGTTEKSLQKKPSSELSGTTERSLQKKPSLEVSDTTEISRQKKPSSEVSDTTETSIQRKPSTEFTSTTQTSIQREPSTEFSSTTEKPGEDN